MYSKFICNVSSFKSLEWRGGSDWNEFRNATSKNRCLQIQLSPFPSGFINHSAWIATSLKLALFVCEEGKSEFVCEFWIRGFWYKLIGESRFPVGKQSNSRENWGEDLRNYPDSANENSRSGSLNFPQKGRLQKDPFLVKSANCIIYNNV